MREIKFRAMPNKDFMRNENQKNTLNSIAYYTKGEFYDDTFIYGYLADGYIIGKTIEAGEEYFVPSYWVPVEKETIGQYTGLKDKNGKKVYEGDIARSGDYTYVVKIGEFAPTWLNEVCGKIGMKKQHKIYGVYAENKDECCIMESGHGFEIIGNIYENPELLEVE